MVTKNVNMNKTHKYLSFLVFLLLIILLYPMYCNKSNPRAAGLGKVSVVPSDPTSNVCQAYNTFEIKGIWGTDLIDLETSFRIVRKFEGKYFLTQLASNNRLFIADESGKVETVIDLNEWGSDFLLDFQIDRKRRQILIGDSEAQSMLYFGFDGNFLGKKKFGFYFLHFAYSSEAERFIFYSPMLHSGVEKGDHAIVLTDGDFNVISTDFPIHTLCQTINILSSFKFSTFEDEVYYNPPLTGRIYKLGFDGIHEEVLSIDYEYKHVEEDIREITKRSMDANAMAKALNRMPIRGFEAGRDHIVIDRMIDKRIRQIIFNVQNRETVVLPRLIKMQNFTEPFCFSALSPSAVVEGNTNIKVFPAESFRSIIQMASENGRVEEDVLKLSSDPKFKGFIVEWTYDWDALKDVAMDTEILFKGDPGDHVKVFPNPTTDRITLRFDEAKLIPEDGMLELVSPLGGIVERQSLDIEKTTYSMDVSYLPKGLYLVRVMRHDGNILTVNKVQVFQE